MGLACSNNRVVPSAPYSVPADGTGCGNDVCSSLSEDKLLGKLNRLLPRNNYTVMHCFVINMVNYSDDYSRRRLDSLRDNIIHDFDKYDIRDMFLRLYYNRTAGLFDISFGVSKMDIYYGAVVINMAGMTPVALAKSIATMIDNIIVRKNMLYVVGQLEQYRLLG